MEMAKTNQAIKTNLRTPTMKRKTETTETIETSRASQTREALTKKISLKFHSSMTSTMNPPATDLMK